MVSFLIPNYIQEGKKSAGRKHRMYRWKTPFRDTGKCVVSASGTVRRIRSTDRAQRHRQRCHPEENERSEVREHVLFQQGERGIVQTDIYSAPLPDRGDRGHLKRLWTGQYLSQRSLSYDRTYRKCVCSKKILYINRKTFNIEAVIHVRKNVYLKKSNVYRVEVSSHEDTVRILQATKFMSPEQEIADDLSVMSRLVIQKECCKRAFLRGTFLAAGSISDPEKGYHLEIVCSTQERAEQIQSIMREFELDARIVARKKSQVVYLKEGSQIVEFLGLVEAGISLMDLENIRIRKEISNNINRKVNCETANIGKTVSAAVKQIEDIRYIETHVGFSQLTEELEETAVCRLRYPEATLKELGEMMSPPVGKSGVNHRLRKLGRIADELRENKEDYND